MSLEARKDEAPHWNSRLGSVSSTTHRKSTAIAQTA